MRLRLRMEDDDVDGNDVDDDDDADDGDDDDNITESGTFNIAVIINSCHHSDIVFASGHFDF